MPRETVNPTNADGTETHPAFGRVVVNRVRSTPGAVLFDSDIRHGEYVVLRVHTADRVRDLNQDWIHADRQVIEIGMSLAQWASMVSSFGNGGGTSCTILYREGEGQTPAIPFASRMDTTMKETLSAADEAYADIKVAFDAYAADKKVGRLRDLERTIEQAVGKVEFAGRHLTRYTEKTVQHARADVEAMVNAHARTLGIDPAEVASALAIESGSEPVSA